MSVTDDILFYEQIVKQLHTVRQLMDDAPIPQLEVLYDNVLNTLQDIALSVYTRYHPEITDTEAEYYMSNIPYDFIPLRTM